MACVKAQLLALLVKLKREVEKCETVDCCRGVLETYIMLVQERAVEEITSQLY